MEFTLIQSWEEQLQHFFTEEIFQSLVDFLENEYLHYEIFPPKNKIFNALNNTPLSEIKVCILGQDPYHGPNQANGLAFSVNPETKLPPSLVNIYKELSDDLQIPAPNNGDLTFWAQQGVLLLNTVLTVRKGQANSHRGKGWEALTNHVISLLNQQENPIVFILWGRPAQKKIALIDTNKHAIIQSPHPSPLSAYRGFFGSKPFSTTNKYLEKWHQSPIKWS